MAVGLLLLVWAATAGPAVVLGRSGHGAVPDGSPAPSPSATATPSGSGTYRQLTRHVHATVDLSWLGQLLGYAALAALALGCLLLLRALWHAGRRDRWLRRRVRSRDRVAFEVLPDRRPSEVLTEEAAAALQAVELGGPRDGIVACWLRLEEIVAARGVTPQPSETATELVTRVLHALDVDPRPVAVLAELYREARFSEHPMDEGSRERARSALRSLREDAARLGAVP